MRLYNFDLGTGLPLPPEPPPPSGGNFTPPPPPPPIGSPPAPTQSPTFTPAGSETEGGFDSQGFVENVASDVGKGILGWIVLIAGAWYVYRQF